jgi:dienelactone hydrolase
MQGMQLVRRGYIVLCPRCFLFNNRASFADNFASAAGNVLIMRERHPDWTGMARMTWDAVRAVDFLESLPNVDPARIGGIGHSLGAKEVLYAAAFDERYKAVVFSEGGIGLSFSNWDAVWYLGPQIHQPGFALDNDQVLALIAPRAFLLLAGDYADGDKSWPYIESVLPIYRLFNEETNIGWFNHHAGHRYPPLAQETAEAFLDAHLK